MFPPGLPKLASFWLTEEVGLAMELLYQELWTLNVCILSNPTPEGGTNKMPIWQSILTVPSAMV